MIVNIIKEKKNKKLKKIVNKNKKRLRVRGNSDSKKKGNKFKKIISSHSKMSSRKGDPLCKSAFIQKLSISL